MTAAGLFSLRRWLPLLLPAAEVCWVLPWLMAFSGAAYPAHPQPLLRTLAVTVLLMGGFVGAYGTGLRGVRLRPARLVVLGGSLLLGVWAVWVSHYRDVPFWRTGWLADLLRAAHDAIPEVPAPVLGALVAPLLFWRGLVLGGRECSHFEAERAFRRGLAWSAIFALLFAVYGETPAFALARNITAPVLLLFFGISLFLLAATRLLDVWEAEAGGGPGAAQGRPWFSLVLAVVTLIVLVAAAFGGLTAADAWVYVQPVLRALAPLLEAVFLVLFLAASLVARVILFLIERIPRRDVAMRPDAPLNLFEDFMRRVRDMDVSPEVVSGARWGMVAGVAILLVVALVLAVALRRRAERSVGDDERESVWDSSGLWRRLRRIVRRRRATPFEDDLSGALEVIAVRMAYRRALGAAAAAGLSRRLTESPSEFLVRMAPTIPSLAELQALTSAYESVRYGLRVPTIGEAEIATQRATRLVEVLSTHQRP